MRIGLPGGASSVDKMIEQAKRAEEDGFTSLWYASVVGGDPLVAMAMAGRATTTIELGTAVLQTYTAHPVLQANRLRSVVDGMGRPGFTAGLGPSHKPPIEDMYGLSYATPGRHTEEYIQVLLALLAGETVNYDGEEFQIHGVAQGAAEVPVLISALAPRLLRVAGELTDGTVLWMGNARAVETHVVPRITQAATAAGRPAAVVVAGLPVAVHDDVDEARAAVAQAFQIYGTLPNYQRILEIGGATGPAEAAIVGNEESVAAQITELFEAGATDVWAAPFPVGEDRAASRNRTRALLKELARS